MILYQGPSMLDGAPIVALATGAERNRNAKTGRVIQVWIVAQEGKPQDNVKSGADVSVCGDCKHRAVDGAGSCYVIAHNAPRSTHDAWLRGRHDVVTDLESYGAGQTIRLGAYGDPAAVPLAVWDALLARAKAWLGYTHQWRTCDPALARYCMASADSPDEAGEAQAAGWRTFRVRTPGESLEAGEIICPASAEAGHKTQCEACKACMGTGGKARCNVAILAHGSKARRFELWRNGRLAA